MRSFDFSYPQKRFKRTSTGLTGLSIFGRRQTEKKKIRFDEAKVLRLYEASKEAGVRLLHMYLANVLAVYYDTRCYRPSDAIQYYQEALLCARSYKRLRRRKIHILNGLGSALGAVGRYDEAVSAYNEALRLTNDRKNSMRAYLFMNLGILHYKYGYFNLFEECLNKTMSIIETSGVDRAYEDMVYGNFAAFLWMKGDYEKAIEYAAKAAELAVDNRLYASAVIHLGRLGQFYFILHGDYDKAFEIIDYAFEIAQRTHDPSAVCHIYAQKARFLLARKNIDKAAELINDGFIFATESQVMLAMPGVELLSIRGMIHEYDEQWDAAQEVYNLILEISKNIGSREYVGLAYEHRGIAKKHLGESPVSDYRAALEYAEKLDDTDQQETINTLLGSFYLEKKGGNNLHQAYHYLSKACDNIDIIYEGITREVDQLWAAVHYYDTFETAADLAALLGEYADAFDHVQRSKSRSLIRMLSFGGIRPHPGVPDTLLNRESVCIERLRLQQQYIGQTAADDMPLSDILTDLKEVYDEIKLYDAEYVSLRQAKPLRVAQIQEHLASHKKRYKRDVFLVEFFCHKDKITTFIVTEDSLHVAQGAEGEYDQVQKDIRQLLSVISAEASPSRIAHRLSDILFKPIKKYLPISGVMYIAPHGELHSLPIHLLILNGKSLASQFEITYLPSATTLAYLARPKPAQYSTCLSIGYQYESEARAVGDLFMSRLLLNASATTEELSRDKQEYDIIHFSCHGEFSEDIETSGLRLSDGMLTMHDVFRLNLSSRLVVLSACDTARNVNISGDEQLGIARAFLFAGAESVLLAMWPVDSESARTFMMYFYKSLKKYGSRTRALQYAQNCMIKTKKWHSPYHWAGYIIVGEGT